MSRTTPKRGETVATIRSVFLAILVVGMLGKGAELPLIKHTGDPMRIPLLPIP